MTKYSTLISLILLILCSCSNGAKEIHLTKQESVQLLEKIAVYTEKRPSNVSKEDRFKPEHKDYYSRVVQVLDMYFEKYSEKDSLKYFLYIKKEIRSLYDDDKRAVGGVFSMDSSGIRYLDIKFITPIVKIDEALSKGKTLFSEMVAKGDVAKYLDNREYLEWPSAEVVYDNVKHEWLLKDSSPFKQLQDSIYYSSSK